VASSPLRHQNNVTKSFPIWAPPTQNFWIRQWYWVNNLMVFKKSGLGLNLGLTGLGLGLEKIGGLDLATSLSQIVRLTLKFCLVTKI